MIGDERVRLPPGVPSVGRPAILVGCSDHAGGNWIHLDVAIAGKQVVIGIDQAGLVPALPQRAGAAIALVDIKHVISAHVLHQPGDRVLLLRSHQQMHMVGHEHVGVQPNAKAPQPLSQQLQVEQVVIITEETDRPIIAALNDMGRYTRKVHPKFACHGSSFANSTGPDYPNIAPK